MLGFNCSEERFYDLFPGRADLWRMVSTKPRDMEDLVRNYLPSKLWRMTNLYHIIDKAGDLIPFEMNYAQLRVYSKLLEHHRLIILKSRQQGISTFFLLYFLDDAIFMSNFNCGLMAQGKDEASTLLERLKFAWNMFPVEIKQLLNIKLTKDNSLEVSFNNDSTMFIRTSFRSATLQRLHISELGKIANKFPERAKETKTGTLQALAPGNIGVIESTAEGVNMFKVMWDAAVLQYAGGKLAGKDFLPVFLSWLDDPDCVEFEPQDHPQDAIEYFDRLEAELNITLRPEQKNFWTVQYRELEGDIYQEYPATPKEAFTAAKDGTYWAKRYVERVLHRNQRRPRSIIFDRNLDLYVCLDAGRNDYFVLVFFQVYRKEIRIVYEYHNSGEWLGHYVDKAKEIVEELEVPIKHWYLPHDMNVTDLSQQENKRRVDVMAELGVTNTTVMPKGDLWAGIEMVRSDIDRIFMAEECEYLHDCVLNYTREWDDARLIWKDTPKRAPWNHGADGIRYTMQAVHGYLDGTATDDDWKAQRKVASRTGL